MPKENVIIKSRPFQGHFADAEHFFLQSQAKLKNKENLMKQNKVEEGQEALALERAYSRACIVSLVAAIESLANSVLKEFQKRDPKDLDNSWLDKRHKKLVLDWSLKEKIKFLPVLCNEDVAHPDEYFDKESTLFKLFGEFIEIRNSIAHGKIEFVKIVVEYQASRIHLADDSDPENFWKLSNTPKDIYSIGGDSAEKCYSTIMKIASILQTALQGKISEIYLREQEFTGQKISGRLSRELRDSRTPDWVKKILGTN